MASSPMRYKKFLEVLPKHNYVVTKAAKEAGFSEHTSNTQQKRILASALRYELNSREEEAKTKLVDTSKLNIKEVKTMAERVGISKDDLMENIKWLAQQEKDLSTRLKVVKALAKEYSVDLGDEEQGKTVVPILNVTVKERNDGSTKPPYDIPQEND